MKDQCPLDSDASGYVASCTLGLATSAPTISHTYIVDSGATETMVNHPSLLTNLHPLSPPRHVKMGNDARLPVREVGTLQLNGVTFHNVWVVLGLNRNLLSCRRGPRKQAPPMYQLPVALYRLGHDGSGANMNSVSHTFGVSEGTATLWNEEAAKRYNDPDLELKPHHYFTHHGQPSGDGPRHGIFQEDDVHVQRFLHNHAGVTHETLSSIICHWLYNHRGPTKQSKKGILKKLSAVRRNLESARGLFGSGAGYDREVQFVKDGKTCTKYIKDISDAKATPEDICQHFKDWDVILRDVRPLDATLRHQSQRNQNPAIEVMDQEFSTQANYESVGEEDNTGEEEERGVDYLGDDKFFIANREALSGSDSGGEESMTVPIAFIL
ncbi:hypothetical protein L202_07605 [Cryptococcus amylolentus CBS 6039]|uniref:Retrovirus-related Pol polyprotein from transposon TNT 1-94-like beta-barrel domain-containing protein n=1 Tax=Cryptococcus amylolentus CBS 6039 TaxID=1295533 RepID=A0A1E3HCU6_9TREE|nr:hypothetical protein L202_07605 [Cryptococcus amylolentus CBS 6039]ODN74154.1 hypothetical protein L202_07605 [Cryptococcus amylolentus CBS 6039]